MAKYETLIYRMIMKYIDPYKHAADNDWLIMSAGTEQYKKFSRCLFINNKMTVICFAKKNIVSFYLLKAKLALFGNNINIRCIVYLDDGLLSSLFDAKNIIGYRCYVKRHLHKHNGLRDKLSNLVPLTWRADIKYIVIERRLDSSLVFNKITPLDHFEQYDFMMFSNPNGKLLLIKTETLKTGKGEVAKTTVNPDYVKVLKKESSTQTYIANRIGTDQCLPIVINSFENNGSFYVIENYINGRSLRDMLCDLVKENSNDKFCGVIERLDAWYSRFHSAFSGEKWKLSLLYSPIIVTFNALYGNHASVRHIVEKVNATLRAIDTWYSGLVPVIAHNDLWPANFIVTSDTLVVIDWERSTEDRACFFDYFWMMISTAIVYIREQNGLPDYGTSYRHFINSSDITSKYVHSKLMSFVCKFGFDENYYSFFMLLFLVEWSVQGYICLGKQTDMDKLAFDEMINYYKQGIR